MALESERAVMPKIATEMSALEVGRLREPGYHFVGNVAGLILQVTESGARSWLLRVKVGVRRREIGLGSYPSLSLADARARARGIREKIFSGADPIEERQAARRAHIAAQRRAITFADAAKRYIAANEAGWKSSKHSAQWTATIAVYAYPVIGELAVSEIETAHVINILEPIWTTKSETASRLRGRIEKVLDWAKARGFREGENPARWQGHLNSILPAKSKVAKVEHHAALDYRRIGAFVSALKEVQGMGARALEFAILTAARSGEVRGAKWAEIDLAAKVWIIPPERMKAGREHRVPLTDAALKLLEDVPRVSNCELIFPNAKAGQLSDMTLTAAIRRMDKDWTKAGGNGWRDSAGSIVTAHGFRSSFRDWAGETTAHPREVIEHALAHRLKDKAEAAYARGDLLLKRRRLMTDWGRYCLRPSVVGMASIAPIRKSKA